ncbi:glutamate racemase [Thermosinus carboxydivorans Nor1]|uniref:Glutamate racemase n=1 Tax=Thermosinus carboxydivorans Nor1 TaxID=401526 RepID=A1HQF1_9FIRM|nr:glutamate racemase [Thermosinus carboxydivorans]EAX47758.1 glutamate racemase [Thermosinus carboxydivorans Nor1]
MGDNWPIGVCDSGIGGLTVVKELLELMPDEHFIYFGDTARIPYGDRPPAEILTFMRQILRFFTEQKVKMVVVACNTMTAVGLDMAWREFPFPVVGVNTGIRSALAASRSGRIGVIATQATVASGLHERTAKAIDAKAVVALQACPKLVPLIEREQLEGPAVEAAVAEYLRPLRDAGVDALILGCTHYPFISPVISRYLGPAVTIVNPARETALDAVSLLAEYDLRGNGPGSVRFCFSADLERARRLAARIIPGPLPAFEKVDMATMPDV